MYYDSAEKFDYVCFFEHGYLIISADLLRMRNSFYVTLVFGDLRRPKLKHIKQWLCSFQIMNLWFDVELCLNIRCTDHQQSCISTRMGCLEHSKWNQRLWTTLLAAFWRNTVATRRRTCICAGLTCNAVYACVEKTTDANKDSRVMKVCTTT